MDMVASVPQAKVRSDYNPDWIHTSRDFLPEGLDDDPLLKSLYESIKEADRGLRDDVYKANASELLERVNSGDKLADLITIDIKRQPILEYLDAVKFGVRLRIFSNDQIRQFARILEETSKYRPPEERGGNSMIIDTYKKIIDNEIATIANKPYRLFELNRLNECVEKLREDPKKHEPK